MNIVSPSLDLEKESIISKAFVKAGGVQLIKVAILISLHSIFGQSSRLDKCG